MKTMLVLPLVLLLGLGLGAKIRFSRMGEKERLDTLARWGGDY